MQRNLLWFFTLILLALISAQPVSADAGVVLTAEEQAWLAAHPEITLGFNPDMEPMVVVGEDGALSGVLIDIYDELESLTGLKVNIEIDSWPSTIAKATRGEIDGLLLSAPALAESIGLSTTHFINEGTPTVFAKTDTPFEINAVEDLIGKKVAVLKGVYVVEQALAPHKDEIEIIEAESAIEMMGLVLDGNVDAAFGLNFHNYLIGKRTLVGIEAVHFAHELSVNGVAAVKKEWPEFISIMNKGLDAMGLTRLNAIANRWTQIEKEGATTAVVLTEKEKTWLETHPNIAPLAFSIRERVQLSAGERKWLSTAPKIPVRVGNSPPFQFVGDGLPQGLSIDYVRVICIAYGLECDYVQGLTIAQSIPLMQEPGGIAIHPGWQQTSERERVMIFTRPYVVSPFVIFQRQDSERVLSMDDLVGKRVVVEKGYAINKMLKDRYPELQLVEVDSSPEAIKTLAAGQADAYVGRLMVGHYLSLELGLSNIVVSAPAPFEASRLKIAVRKDMPELASIIDKSIAAMTPEEHKVIRNRWVSVGYKQEIDYGLLWKATLGFLVVLAGVLAWNLVIRRQKAALAESEARYRTLFTNSGIGIVLVDISTRYFTNANQQFLDFIGYSLDELKSMSPLDITHPDDHEETRRVLDYNRTAEPRVSHLAKRYVHKDGRTLWGQVVSTQINMGSGKTFDFATIADITDLHAMRTNLEEMVTKRTAELEKVNEELHSEITERKQVESLLLHAKDEAEYANHAKTQFLANMSHELRTPLNGIIGFSEMMIHQVLGPMPEAYGGYATDIQNSGLHLLELITDILDISMIDMGEVNLVETDIALPELALACIKIVQAKAHDDRVSISLDTPDNLPLLRADETRIKQVLLNLLSNSVKFTPVGGQIYVDAHCDVDGAMTVRVKDTGCGIAKEHISKVLEPFEQVEDIFSRSHEGSGLGLPLSKGLIELHGGSMAIDSTIGKGTTVTVKFPPERSIRDNIAI